MSIRLRLTLWFLALLASLMVARSVFIVGAMDKVLHDDALSDAQGRAAQVRDFLEDLAIERHKEGGSSLSLSDPEALPRAFYDDGMYVQLCDAKGRIIQRSPNLGTLTLPILGHHEHRTVSLPLPHLFLSPKVMLTEETIRIQESAIGSIQVGRAMQYSQRTLYNLLEIELGTLVVGVLLALGSGFWLAGLTLRPVSKLTAAVNQMQANDLHRRLEVASPPDELDILAATFNRLFDRLEGAFEMQRCFVADVSHEFKSPLTSIRGHAQLIMKRGEANPDRLQEWSGSILRETDRLSRLVGDMLLLAREDHGIDHPPTETVDLAVLAADVVESLRPAHPELRPLEVEGSDLRIVSSTDRLRQVLLNLLDNAFRATQQKGDVQVKLLAEDRKVLLRVEDTGHGIAPEHLSRIFDRFYRVDTARDRAGGGTGLGLAIVESIVKSHGGQLEVASKPDVGTTFTLSFPSAPEQTLAVRMNARNEIV